MFNSICLCGSGSECGGISSQPSMAVRDHTPPEWRTHIFGCLGQTWRLWRGAWVPELHASLFLYTQEL